MALRDVVIADSPFWYTPVESSVSYTGFGTQPTNWGFTNYGTGNPTFVQRAESGGLRPWAGIGVDDGFVATGGGGSTGYNYLHNMPLTAGELSAMTVEFWMKTDDTTKTEGSIFYVYNGSATPAPLCRIWADFTSTGNGTLRVVWGDYPSGGISLDTGVKVNDNEWHHVVLVGGSGNLKVYIDGDQVGGAAFNLTNGTTATNRYYWGTTGSDTTASTGTRVYKGQLDHTAIYLAPLSAAQVTAHYNAGMGIVPVIPDITVPADAPATAAAEMPFPAHAGPADITMAAGLMSASGEMIIPKTHEDSYTGIAKSPLVRTRSTAATDYITETAATVNTYPQDRWEGGREVVIDVPDVSALLAGPKDQHVVTLRINRVSGTAPSLFLSAVVRIDGVWQFVSLGTISAVSQTITLPNNVKEVVITARLGGSSPSNFTFSNPSYGTGATGSYFTVTAYPDTGVYPVADAPMTAAGEMLEPSVSIFMPHVTIVAGVFSATATIQPTIVSTGSDVNIPLATATASALMTPVTLPDWTQEVAPATGTAEMEEAWFKSERKVTVASATAASEFLEPALTYESNIIVTAEPMEAESNIYNPAEVSDDVGDRLFDEIAKDHSVAAHAYKWLRFNETTGNLAYSHNAQGRITTGSTIATKPNTIAGTFARVQAPMGRKAVHFIDATLDGVGTAYQGVRPYLTGGSLELMMRTTDTDGTLIHTDWVWQSGPGSMPMNKGIKLVDGYLVYYSENFRRGAQPWDFTSLGVDEVRITNSRINDGKWHQIVIQSSDRGFYEFPGRPQDFRPGIDVYIDSRLHKTTTRNPRGLALESLPWVSPGGETNVNSMTSTMFQGLNVQVMELFMKNGQLHRDRIMDHYLAMWDYYAVRAAVAGAVAAAGDHKAETNMKRMLILTWQIPIGRYNTEEAVSPAMESVGGTDWLPRLTGISAKSYDIWTGDAYNPRADDITNIENLHITYQDVQRIKGGSEQGWSAVNADPNLAPSAQFIDDVTGEPRFIDLQKDIVDLEDFDVVYIQNYPNPIFREQASREKYERFFDSVRQAVVDGMKLWITNPALAADLDIIDEYMIVPTAQRQIVDGKIVNRYAVDVRAWQTMPLIHHSEQGGNVEVENKARTGIQPWPEDIKTIAEAESYLRTTGGIKTSNVLSLGAGQGMITEPNTRVSQIDSYDNTRFRVVNEVEGLTDLPSWYVVEEAYWHRQNADWKTRLDWSLAARRYENRTGEDTPYGESKGTGLKVGDEFIDWGIQMGLTAGEPNRGSAFIPKQERYRKTYAIVPGNLLVGRPVSTFGSTHWNDVGQEVPNPYRNHITTAVVMPGDRWKGQVVGGYIFMNFSENPNDTNTVLPLDMNRNPWLEEGRIPEMLENQKKANNRSPHFSAWGELQDWDEEGYPAWGRETPYTLSWQYNTHRVSYVAGTGVSVQTGGMGELIFVRQQTDSDGNLTTSIRRESARPGEMAPQAKRYSSTYGVVYAPYRSWNYRGIQWLKNAEPKREGFNNVYADASTATATMTETDLYNEADVLVGAQPAVARGVALHIVGMGDRAAEVFAYPATATGRMNDPGKVVQAQAMTVIGEIGQNNTVSVALGAIEWLNVDLNRLPIWLSVEETGTAPPASQMVIQGQVINNTGGNT